MQVSATLIAAQQAAREARTRLNVPQPAPAQQPGFASALEATSGFSALPLKLTAPAASAAAPQAAAPAQAGARLGIHVDITV